MARRQRIVVKKRAGYSQFSRDLMNEMSASLLWSSISMNLTPTPQSSSR
jgi:hypothetical protein